MVERTWHDTEEGVRKSSDGDRLVSGSKNQTDVWTLPSTIEGLLGALPENLREYTIGCLSEHQPIVDALLASGYAPVELCFRDYLSGPHNEIAGDNIALLTEAFADDCYELVPTFVFANERLANPNDDIAETSSVFVEFHKRGMAF